jgi:hypothetical protein
MIKALFSCSTLAIFFLVLTYLFGQTLLVFATGPLGLISAALTVVVWPICYYGADASSPQYKITLWLGALAVIAYALMVWLYFLGLLS